LLYGGYGTGETKLVWWLPNLMERIRAGISDAEAMSVYAKWTGAALGVGRRQFSNRTSAP